jgi:hypothetical protein
MTLSKLVSNLAFVSQNLDLILMIAMLDFRFRPACVVAFSNRFILLPLQDSMRCIIAQA